MAVVIRINRCARVYLVLLLLLIIAGLQVLPFNSWCPIAFAAVPSMICALVTRTASAAATASIPSQEYC